MMFALILDKNLGERLFLVGRKRLLVQMVRIFLGHKEVLGATYDEGARKYEFSMSRLPGDAASIYCL